MKKKLKDTLFTSLPLTARSVLVVMSLFFISCVANTPHEKVDTSKFSISSDDANYCTSSRSNGSPFANSSDSPTGTSASDPYRICTAAQFNQIGTSSAYWSKYFILMTDINLSSYSSSTLNRIGSAGTAFSGTFLGNGKQIIGGTLSAATTDYFALFSFVGPGAVIKDLTLTSFTITGKDYVGVLVGKMTGGSLSNIILLNSTINGQNYVGGLIGLMVDGSVNRSSFSVTSTSSSPRVIASANYAGGLIGDSQSGAINYCSTSLPGVSGVSYVGGLVGYNEGAAIFGSSAQTNTNSGVVGTSTYVGGLVGYNKGVISTSYATHSRVEGITYVGGLIGWNESDVEKSYTTITSSSGVLSTNYSGGLIGYNLSGDIYLSYTVATKIYASTSYAGGLIGYLADGIVESSYAKISSRVQAGSSYIGGLIGYALLGTVYNSYSELLGTSTSGSLAGSTIVGGLIGENAGADVLESRVKATSAFGNFSSFGGLIGSMSGGSVDDCVLDIVGIGTTTATGTKIGSVVGVMTGGDILSATSSVSGSIYGGSYVGGIVGHVNSASSRVESVVLTVTGSVNAKSVGSTYSGGAIGYNIGYAQNITTTINAGITSAGDYVGGLVGYNTGALTISTLSTTSLTAKDSIGGIVGYSAGQIQSVSGTYTGNIQGDATYVGGFAGWIAEGYIYSSSISVTGNVTKVATGDYLGGFVGIIQNNGGTANDVKIINSSATITGNVAQQLSSDYVGGFVGGADDLDIISNCSANITGNILGDEIVGGFAGYVTSRNIGLSKAIIGGYVEGLNAVTAQVGGFVGQLAGTVDDSYARVTGYISGNAGTSSHVGGFVGYLFGGKIHNVYSTATTVKGSNNIGGLAGTVLGGEISHSFSVANIVGVVANAEVEYILGASESTLLPVGNYTYLYYSSSATCSPYVLASSCIANTALDFTPTELKDPSTAALSSTLYLTWDFTNFWYNNSATSDYPTLR